MLLSVDPKHSEAAPRRRLTQAEWDAELARAKSVQAGDCARHYERHIVAARLDRGR
jgi:hypothetical protein